MQNRWLAKDNKARCRLMPNGWLVMEYVRQAKESWEDLPRWTYGVDCKQVGYTHDGRLVAYDYA